MLNATHKWSNILDHYSLIRCRNEHNFVNTYFFLLWLVGIIAHMWNIGKLISKIIFLTESAMAEQNGGLLSLVSSLLKWSVTDG